MNSPFWKFLLASLLFVVLPAQALPVGCPAGQVDHTGLASDTTDCLRDQHLHPDFALDPLAINVQALFGADGAGLIIGKTPSGSWLLNADTWNPIASSTWDMPFRSALLDFKTSPDGAGASYRSIVATLSESSPVVLMLLGLLGLAFARRKSRRG